MSNALTPAIATAGSSERSRFAARAADYLELTKPRIAVMALVTVTVGFLLARETPWDVTLLFESLVGVALVAAASSTFNQLIECQTDRLMNRTRHRPLVTGRLSSQEAIWFGGICLVAGLVWLATRVNLLTCLVAVVTFVLYVAIYTPLKRVTTFNTVIGAIPGALPPVLGWIAAGGELDRSAFTLFAILFLWQFPHFMAIAWLYREDYTAAGLKMIPNADASKHWGTGLVAVGYASVLLPVALLPSQVGLAGGGYACGAFLLGLGYLWFSIAFHRRPSVGSARQLLLASLIYLPVLFLILVGDHFRLLG